MSEIQSVGIREFRANLHKYTVGQQQPIAITSNGRPIGYFIPVQPSLEQDKIEALRKAQTQLATMLEESGVTEDEIVAEFNHLKKNNHHPNDEVNYTHPKSVEAQPAEFNTLRKENQDQL